MDMFKDTKIYTITEDAQLWFRLKDVAIYLGNAFNFYTAHKHRIEIKHFAVEGCGGTQLSLFTDRDGLIYILTKSRKPKSTELLRLIKPDMFAVPSCDSIMQIKTIFSALEFRKGYKVDNYEVGLLIPEYNIVLEYDVNDAIRKQKISDVLKPPLWIELTPDFDIIPVIAKITSEMHRQFIYRAQQ